MDWTRLCERRPIQHTSYWKFFNNLTFSTEIFPYMLKRPSPAKPCPVHILYSMPSLCTEHYTLAWSVLAFYRREGKSSLVIARQAFLFNHA